MTKPSPGPWHYQEDADDYTHIVRTASGFIVHQGPQWTDGVTRANARLIAESPQMYKAIKGILEGFDKGVFVRSTAWDGEPGWALKLLPFIVALREAGEAIEKVEDR